ncbi:MAG: Ligase [Ramlibacter sp.]|nr:Ligase [Ramlibacter sp.]
MQEHIRSLIVVFAIALVVFHTAQRSFEPFTPTHDYRRRRNAFLALTACGFLAPGFWFYAVPALVVVLFTARREDNPPALFFALLFAVPPAAEEVSGMGLVNFLVAVDHPRLLAILLLLPAAFRLPSVRRSAATRWPDRAVMGYLLLQAVLALSRSPSLTSGLRALTYLAIDVLLPYYVMSRAFRDLRQIKEALCAFCAPALVLAAVAMLETTKNWLLYRSLLDRWETDFGMGNYLLRGGSLRAVASTGHPIVLGYVLMVALVCFLALKPQMRPGIGRSTCLLLLIGGMFATFSRGPWLAALAAWFAFWATATPARMRVGLVIAAGVSLVWLLDSQLPLLPALTAVDQSTVLYRADLLSKALDVLQERPWFGSTDYVQHLAARGMVQGQGIVDIVNTYVGVALANGIVGLALFLCLFATVLRKLWTSRGQYRSGSLYSEAGHTAPGGMEGAATAPDDAATILRALMACLVGTLVTIASVSSISVIPWVYWSLLGTAVAFVRLGTPTTDPRRL